MRDELEIQLRFTKSRQDTSAKSLRQNLSSSVSRLNLSDVIISFSVYLLLFSTIYFLNKSTILLDIEYFISLGYFLISLILGASLSQKFSLAKRVKNVQIVKDLYLSLVITLISLIIIFLFVEINANSRDIILSALIIGILFELFYFLISSKNHKNKISFGEQLKLSLEFIILDGLILSFFFYIEIIANKIPNNFLEQEFLLMPIVFFSWVISAAATHKFVPLLVSTSRMNAFELQVKFYFRIISLVLLGMIFLQLDFVNATNSIRALVGYSFVSSMIFMILFAKKIKNKNDEATIVFLRAYEMKDLSNRKNGKNGNGNGNGNGKYCYHTSEITNSLVEKRGQFEYPKEYGEVFSILDTILDLKSFDSNRSNIIKSDNLNDISTLQAETQELIANLHVLNDQHNLNEYLLNIRKKLVDGGVFVGALLPHHYRYRRYLKKYSFYMANILYFFDCIWKRVMPKLPITREIYFTFSKEKDRAISLAEGLGRLVYCGFKVLDLAAVDDVVYFAAVKNGTPAQDNKFFYSPIFKMKRVGKGGKPIYVYKFRTMYPYSEFIQDFVFKHNSLEIGGKFKDDFRVPIWGRLFRKLWIDELPMLINWVKGELKLVGVRPISNQYLSLYSKDHQERRKYFKPGLIPPFYADLPETIEEIELSEKRYLESYISNPFKTDFMYFFKGVKNILIKQKRSA